MTNLALVHGSSSSSVDPVESIALALTVELLDDADGLLTNSAFSLLSGSTTMVGSVNASMLRDRVNEFSGLNSGLTVEHISANPKGGAGLELSEKGLLVDNITTRGVDQHTVVLHLTEEFSVDHTLSLRSRGGVDRYNIGTGKELVLAHIGETKFLLEASLLSASADNDLHVEGLGGSADKLADVTEANESEGAALDTSAVSKHTLVPLSLFEHVDAFGGATVD